MRNRVERMIVDILEILFAGMCVGLASSVTVGPVAVLCIQRTLSKGHLSGLMSGMGVAIADALLAILAFSVFTLLKSYIDEYNTAIQICAGVFVILVGIFIFFKNPVPQIRKNRAGKKNLWQDFASMFGFTLANFVVIIPYILAFFAMFNVDLSTSKVEEKSAEQVEVVAKEHSAAATRDVVEDAEGEQTNVNAPKVTVIDYEAEAQGDEVASVADNETENSATAVATNDNTKSEVAKRDGEEGMSSLFYNALIILGFLLGAMLWWLALTSIINLFRKGFRPRHMLTINHIAGVVIGILGIYTLLSVLIKF